MTIKSYVPLTLFVTFALGAGLMMLPAESTAAEHAKQRMDQLLSPARLSVGPSGILLVTDYRAQAVFMVSRTNVAKVIRSFSIDGRPLGIAWARGRIYVGNETTGAVEVYNPAGKLMYTLGGAPGSVKQPSDIAVDASRGLVFVVDGHEKRIRVFGLKGPELTAISGIGAGSLVNPIGIALDQTREEILVSDYGHPADSSDERAPSLVHIFDYDGNKIAEISGSRRFSRPQGLAVEEGHIYLADGMLGQVLVLDRSSGATVATLGEFGTGPGQLQLPLDVVIDPSSKDVYVTNNRAARIELFEGGGQVP